MCFLPKDQMFSVQSPKNSKQIISSKISNGHADCCFRKPTENFLVKVWKKLFFLQKKTARQNVFLTLRMQFRQLVKNFRQPSEKLFAKSPETKRNSKLPTRIIFLKLILWTSKIQLWQPYKNFFYRKSENGHRFFDQRIKKIDFLLKEDIHYQSNHLET